MKCPFRNKLGFFQCSWKYLKIYKNENVEEGYKISNGGQMEAIALRLNIKEDMLDEARGRSSRKLTKQQVKRERGKKERGRGGRR